MKWISVKERLPLKDQHVLITNGEDIFVGLEMYHNNNDDSLFWNYSWCCGCIAENITHWMPLPEPPNGEE